jgi:ferric-dicitrate binding protein FerR (iron transport regulator)
MGLLMGLVLVSCGPAEDNVLREGQYHVGAGSGRSFRIPAFGTVFLEPNTTISLAKGFGKGNREISLDGEALFEMEVAGAPVRLLTKDLVIEVPSAGRFRVDAYREKGGEEVDVLEGRMAVAKSYHSDTDSASEVLVPGEMVMINRGIDLMEKEKMSQEEIDKAKKNAPASN